ncbi:MAG: oligosaccharide flippase family protein [Sedimentisphaerales bacterium]|nr:oligosaccharide flippase family protein [Sedimentisphaerales bacterium]
MNTIRQNTIANFIARAWGIISVYLFVPLYLKFLGIEAYGLVGFYSTLLGVLAFADMGFTATLSREMARLSVLEDSAEEMRDLLRTYESTYLCISSVLAVLIWALAPLIAEHWLRSKVLQPHEMAAAIRLMGVSIALQLPSGLYIGGLMGLQRQVRANSLQIAWGIFRGFGAVLVLWLCSPTIFAFALWQLISNAVYCFCIRLSLWDALSFSPGQPRPKFKWQVFRNTWRYAAGMAGMSVVSIFLKQTDKLAVSKMLSLEMLGYYTLAWALASAPITLASPIASAVFPRLTGLVAIGDRNGLARLYHRTCELAAVAIIPAGLTIALFAGDFIFAWTGSATIAQRAGLAASLLLAGQIMQAIMVVPYYLALAHGDVRLNLQIGIVSVALITPLLIYLITKYGVVGAGISWLVMNLCTLPPYMYFLYRRFLPGELKTWILYDVGRPLLAALPIVLLGRWLLPLPSSRLLTLGLIGLVWIVSAAVAAVIIPELRNEFIKKTGKLFGVSYGM